MEKYFVMIEVRDENRNLLCDHQGVKMSTFSFEAIIPEEERIKPYLKQTHETFKAWMPTRIVNIQMYVFSQISGTYTEIAYISNDGVPVILQ
jgi:hypothetical protein